LPSGIKHIPSGVLQYSGSSTNNSAFFNGGAAFDVTAATTKVNNENKAEVRCNSQMVDDMFVFPFPTEASKKLRNGM